MSLPLLVTSCSPNNDQTALALNQQNAANAWRFETPEGRVPVDQVASNLEIKLSNRFPVWRDTIAVAVDVSIRNISKSHLPARVTAKLYVYSFDQKQPEYWTNIDIAYAESTGPTTKSILSLPVSASKDISIPILATQWADVHTAVWPNAPFYAIVPTGKHLMRFELEIFDEEDRSIDSAVSNFIQFTTVAAAPDVIKPEELKP
ncbi:MAG: hypothetical protein IKY83_12925 [Proteobacteria bacterium]|nr:hypothetical protein [Pseudomonadota bacterium]